MLGRIDTADGRVQLELPDLLEELGTLAAEQPSDDAWPFVLSAGERRSYTANTIVRHPAWRKKDAGGALRISPIDASALAVATGDRVRVTTPAGSAVVQVEVSDTMRAGHVSLPNGLGTDHPTAEAAGVSPNELTSHDHRDPFAGTPWHKHVPARIEALV